MVETKEYRGSYKSYVKFKRIIDVLRKAPCTRKHVAEEMGVELVELWHIFRVLTHNKIIKRTSYDLNEGQKRAVYTLVKDD